MSIHRLIQFRGAYPPTPGCSAIAIERIISARQFKREDRFISIIKFRLTTSRKLYCIAFLHNVDLKKPFTAIASIFNNLTY